MARLIKLTTSEAKATVRVLVSKFHEATPAGGFDESDFSDLAAQLSWFIGARVKDHSIVDVYEAFEALAQVEDGTHPDLVTNKAGTVDNTEHVLDLVDMQLDGAVYFLLQSAAFIPRPDWEQVAA